MPASNLFMNWGTTTVTPTAPSGVAIAIDTILDVKVNGKSMQKAFFGDNLQFARLMRNTQKTRSITIVLGNVKKALDIPEDAECTVTAVLLDAINGSGSGAITITAVRAKLEGKPFGGKNNDYAGAELTFNCAGGTNDADPITVAVAA